MIAWFSFFNSMNGVYLVVVVALFIRSLLLIMVR